MLDKLLDVLFGCQHKRMGFPITSSRPRRTYRVCLECGREFTYDWSQMKVVEPTANRAGRESEVVA